MNKILLFDGATGTMLQGAGLPVGASPDIWNLERAETIQDIHRQYINAGSDIISTVTFRAGTFDSSEARKIIRTAVLNAKEAISGCADDIEGRQVHVALDIGPMGKLVGIAGGPDFHETYDYYKAQVIEGADAGADLILFETFADTYELKIAVLAARENTELPIMASMTFEEGGRTMMGTDAETAALIFRNMDLEAFGINCSLGPDEMLPLIKKITKYAKSRVIAQPNAGLPRIEDGNAIYDISPAVFAQAVSEIVASGCTIVGGCCGTTPEYIEALASMLPEDMHCEANKSFTYPSICSVGSHALITPDSEYRLQKLSVSDGDTKKQQSAIKKLSKNPDVIVIEIEEPAYPFAEAIAAAASSNSHAILAFECKDSAVLEQAIRASRGKPAVISNAEVAKKYGIAVIIEEDALTAARESKLCEDMIVIAKDGLLSPCSQ